MIEESIHQTDPQWKQVEDPHSWCYFLATLYIAAWKLNVDCWHHEAIQTIWKKAEDFKDLGTDGATVLNPQGLMDLVAGPNRATFLGHQASTYPTASNQAEILVYCKPNASFNHFVVGDGKKGVLYDPWSPKGSDSVKSGRCVATRIWNIV